MSPPEGAARPLRSGRALATPMCLAELLTYKRVVQLQRLKLE